MLASDYPLAGVLWTTLAVVLGVVFLLTLVYVVGDIFRRHDMRGVAKAVWLLWVLFMPFLGVIIYVYVHGDVMTDKTMQARTANEKAMEGYFRLRG